MGCGAERIGGAFVSGFQEGARVGGARGNRRNGRGVLDRPYGEALMGRNLFCPDGPTTAMLCLGKGQGRLEVSSDVGPGPVHKRCERKSKPIRPGRLALCGNLAGAPGFEPGNVGTKNRCLTTWRRPNYAAGSSQGAAWLQALCRKYFDVKAMKKGGPKATQYFVRRCGQITS